MQRAKATDPDEAVSCICLTAYHDLASSRALAGYLQFAATEFLGVIPLGHFGDQVFGLCRQRWACQLDDRSRRNLVS